MSQIIRFPHHQFQVIQFRPWKQIHLRPVEGVFSHSVTSTEGVFCHSVPSTEADPLTSTEDRSQMNCASISRYGRFFRFLTQNTL